MHWYKLKLVKRIKGEKKVLRADNQSLTSQVNKLTKQLEEAQRRSREHDAEFCEMQRALRGTQLTVTEKIWIFWLSSLAAITALACLGPIFLYSDHSLGNVKSDNFWSQLQSSFASTFTNICFCISVRKSMVPSKKLHWLLAPSVVSLILAILSAALSTYVTKYVSAVLVGVSMAVQTLTGTLVALLNNSDSQRNTSSNVDCNSRGTQVAGGRNGFLSSRGSSSNAVNVNVAGVELGTLTQSGTLGNAPPAYRPST